MESAEGRKSKGYWTCLKTFCCSWKHVNICRHHASCLFLLQLWKQWIHFAICTRDRTFKHDTCIKHAAFCFLKLVRRFFHVLRLFLFPWSLEGILDAMSKVKGQASFKSTTEYKTRQSWNFEHLQVKLSNSTNWRRPGWILKEFLWTSFQLQWSMRLCVVCGWFKRCWISTWNQGSAYSAPRKPESGRDCSDIYSPAMCKQCKQCKSQLANLCDTFYGSDECLCFRHVCRLSSFAICRRIVWKKERKNAALIAKHTCM